MAKEDAVEAMARVLETLPDAMIRVELEGKRPSGSCACFGEDAPTFYSQSSRDKVLGELWPYDLNRGQITYRYK